MCSLLARPVPVLAPLVTARAPTTLSWNDVTMSPLMMPSPSQLLSLASAFYLSPAALGSPAATLADELGAFGKPSSAAPMPGEGTKQTLFDRMLMSKLEQCI